ncbi:hypothetical protein CSC81_10585 [Tenacibaculum discolor]|uniref:Uncharacterized protein n=1 Tax=Tenacibaculum discolor TaxID=361581 RepID=A0A2G1BS16_9FLAO|nr:MULTISPECIES: hypothetical protein [Tenacibaculum]MDP2542382.1 hypothetical protein [Tenacibaculum discolor]NVK08337.1 hypothetical protein [Tenacibaculum sp.]PHN96861.1 hypothetical protein CSC81_10585 [Tenacibaculum discolor]
MKNKKVSLGKLKLNKMTVNSLQSVRGGKMEEDSALSNCDCDSINTRFTRIQNCCVWKPPY